MRPRDMKIGCVYDLVPECTMLLWDDFLKGRSRHCFDADGNLVVESGADRLGVYEYIRQLVSRGVCDENGKRKTNSQNNEVA